MKNNTARIPTLILLVMLAGVEHARGQEAAPAPVEDYTWWYVSLAVLVLGLVGALVYWNKQRSLRKLAEMASQQAAASQRVGQNGERRAGVNRESAGKEQPDWLLASNGRKNGSAKIQKSESLSSQTAGQKVANSTSYVYELEPHSLASQVVPSVVTTVQHNPQLTWKLNAPSQFVPLPSTEDEAILDAVEQLREGDDDESMRSLSVRVLSACRTQNAVEGLRQVALYDASSRLRVEAVAALGGFNHESVFEPILLACADPTREVRAAAARNLTRLDFDRADAFVRVIESRDPERLRLAALACVEAGLASRAFERLSAEDPKQSYEAFTILTLLVKAENFPPILEVIENHRNQDVRLATINALHKLNPVKILPSLYKLSAKENLPAEVKDSVQELIYHLNQTA